MEVSAFSFLLRKLTAQQLKNWERTKVDAWRHDQPLNRQIAPPDFF